MATTEQMLQNLDQRMQQVEAGMQRLEVVEQQIGQALANINLVTADVENTKNRLNELAAQLLFIGNQSRLGGSGLTSTVDLRVLGKPKEFNGSQERWTAWSFQFESFCGACDQRLADSMMLATTSELPIAMPTEVGDVMLSRTLYHMLVMLVQEDSPAYTKMQACPRGNGMEAWRRFHVEWEPKVRGRYQSMLQAILQAVSG